MDDLSHLFERNRQWAERITNSEPDFFQRLARQQAPEYLWIGCSDSRVPANQIVGLLPGDIFVHRNVSNLVVHTDLNCLSVIQYAVEVLHVRHIIVCGHYGCGGVLAALRGQRLGLIDNWLRHVQDVQAKYESALRALATDVRRSDLMCELNVIEQVFNACHTTVVQEAWKRGTTLTVHGWIYGIEDGQLRDLLMTAASSAELSTVHKAAVARSIEAAGSRRRAHEPSGR
jgi:carbonic anhydrase